AILPAARDDPGSGARLASLEGFHPLRRDLLVALGERAQAADRIARKALRRGGLAHRAEPEAIRGAPGGAEGGALRAAIGRLDRPAQGAGENPDLPEGPEARIGSCLRRVRFLPSIRATSRFTPPRSPLPGENTGMRRTKRSTIEDMADGERPRERLLGSGPGVLTDADLVAVLFGTGGPGEGILELSARVTGSIPLRQLQRVPVEELLQIRGMGKARAAQLLAAAEL